MLKRVAHSILPVFWKPWKASIGLGGPWNAGYGHSQVVVRLSPEDRPQTPTEVQALYEVLSVRFVQLIRLPQGTEAFQKQMLLPPKGSVYTQGPSGDSSAGHIGQSRGYQSICF